MLSFIHQLVFIYTNYLWFLCKRERSRDVHSNMQATCVDTLSVTISSCTSKLYSLHINWCLSTPLNLWSLRAVTELWIALCFCIYFVITAYRSQYTRSQHDAAHWYCFGKIHKLGGFEKKPVGVRIRECLASERADKIVSWEWQTSVSEHWYCLGKIHKLGGLEKSQFAWLSYHRNKLSWEWQCKHFQIIQAAYGSTEQ